MSFQHRVEYSISEADRKLAHDIAVQRRHSHDHPGTPWVPGPQSDILSHEVGALGELVVAKWLETKWEYAFLPREQWKKNYGKLTDLCGLEVRTTATNQDRVPIYPKDHGRPIYAYVWVDIRLRRNFATIWGFLEYHLATDPRFIDEANRADLRGNPTHVVPRHELKPPEFLKDTMKALRRWRAMK